MRNGFANARATSVDAPQSLDRKRVNTLAERHDSASAVHHDSPDESIAEPVAEKAQVAGVSGTRSGSGFDPDTDDASPRLQHEAGVNPLVVERYTR